MAHLPGHRVPLLTKWISPPTTNTHWSEDND